MKEFLHAFIWGMIFWFSLMWSIPGHPANLPINPMHCQESATERKRIEMQLTKRIFMLWDKQGRIKTHTDMAVETAWDQANAAAKRITDDNFKCRR